MTGEADLTEIRWRLNHAWLPFFTRFGNLTPVQRQVIPKILDGRNVVVASATASGKTEAVVAPTAQRSKSEQWKGLSIVYIVPTRALANDTLSRIQGPLGDMGIATALKHGDRPHLPAHLPNCLITTPESLDSLICRRPKYFAGVRTIILDEIHLLDGTYRGDQLRLLLSRLLKLTSSTHYSTHLLSATMPEPERIAQRYVGNFDVVVVEGRREIEWMMMDSLEEVHQVARSDGRKKILCFCNKRESVETTAAYMADLWHPYPVLAHHGSLTRRVREEVETVMKEAPVAVCVATSTLEVGIDIGDIDLIVLAEVPWSVSSLLQRIGRGNRRDDTVHVAAVVNSADARFLMEGMFELAATGALSAGQYEPDLSVAIQQTFSFLFQYPVGATEEQLVELTGLLCTADEVRLIIEHLRQSGWLEWRTGRWFASTRVMDIGEKGRIHSNIPDAKTYRVVDVDSGNDVGSIAGVFDDVFVLAQRSWRVVSVKGSIIRARRFNGKASAPVFRRHGEVGAFYHLLPRELRHREA